MKHVAMTLGLLFAATSIASAAPRDRLAAAAQIYAGALADWETGEGKTSLSDVHAWSVQLLEAQLATPARAGAFAAHVARMVEVEAEAQRDATAGLIGSDLALAEATFFRVEAQRWQGRGRIF